MKYSFVRPYLDKSPSSFYSHSLLLLSILSLVLCFVIISWKHSVMSSYYHLSLWLLSLSLSFMVDISLLLTSVVKILLKSH